MRGAKSRGGGAGVGAGLREMAYPRVLEKDHWLLHPETCAGTRESAAWVLWHISDSTVPMLYSNSDTEDFHVEDLP